MRPEDPDELLAGSGLSSEEYLQCLLTMLIIGGPYPTWNTRSVPSPEGRRFLQLLDALSFDSASEARGAVFIDEFDLPKRPKDAAGRAPDWCVLTGTRLWMIELKTLAGSHDPGQLPAFLELAQHHYSKRFIDLTYITPPLTKPAPELGGRMRYRHLTWKQVRPLLIRVWGRATAGSRDRRLLDAANAVIDSLASPGWRGGMFGSRHPASPSQRSAEVCSASRPRRAAPGPRQVNRTPTSSLLRPSSPPTINSAPSPWPPAASRTFTIRAARSATRSPSTPIRRCVTYSLGCGSRAAKVTR